MLFGTFLCRARPRCEIFYATLFGGRENKHGIQFFFLSWFKLGCGPQDSTPVKFFYSFPVFSKLEYKCKSLRKHKFVLIVMYLLHLPSIFLKHPIFMNVTLSFWFYRKALWSKEESIMICWKNCLLYKTGIKGNYNIPSIHFRFGI